MAFPEPILNNVFFKSDCRFGWNIVKGLTFGWVLFFGGGMFCFVFLIGGISELGKGKFVATLLAHISTTLLTLGVGIVCEL